MAFQTFFWGVGNGAGDHTQGIPHAKIMLYHLAVYYYELTQPKVFTETSHGNGEQRNMDREEQGSGRHHFQPQV